MIKRSIRIIHIAKHKEKYPPGGSTATLGGSTAGVLAVVPLPLAVVPLGG